MTLDNFTLAAITPPTLPFTDAFTQANGTQLTDRWTQQQGNFSITNNTLIANDPTINIATLDAVSLAKAAVQSDVVLGANQGAGLISRFQSNGNYYLGMLLANAAGTSYSAYIFSYINGSFAQLNTVVPTVASGPGTLRFEVNGTSLKLYYGQGAAPLSLLVNVVNSSITTAGLTGVRTSKNALIDNFSVDQLP